jgi:hypothetical protein
MDKEKFIPCPTMFDYRHNRPKSNIGIYLWESGETAVIRITDVKGNRFSDTITRRDAMAYLDKERIEYLISSLGEIKNRMGNK